MMGGMTLCPSQLPSPLRRWQVAQAASSPSTLAPPSRSPRRERPEGNTPWRYTRSPVLGGPAAPPPATAGAMSTSARASPPGPDPDPGTHHRAATRSRSSAASSSEDAKPSIRTQGRPGAARMKVTGVWSILSPR